MVVEKLLLLIVMLSMIGIAGAKAIPIPMISGPQDISNTNSTLNAVIQQLNGLLSGSIQSVNIFSTDPPAPSAGQCEVYFVRSGPTTVNLSSRCGPSGSPLVLQTNIGTTN